MHIYDKASVMEVLSKTIDDIPMSVLMKGLHLWSLTNTFCTNLVILSLSVLEEGMIMFIHLQYTWHSSQQLVNILEMDKHDH
jgi:hypothetical protein